MHQLGFQMTFWISESAVAAWHHTSNERRRIRGSPLTLEKEQAALRSWKAVLLELSLAILL
jgi:hypothetical protein